jgi:hypothetical protein
MHCATLFGWPKRTGQQHDHSREATRDRIEPCLFHEQRAIGQPLSRARISRQADHDLVTMVRLYEDESTRANGRAKRGQHREVVSFAAVPERREHVEGDIEVGLRKADAQIVSLIAQPFRRQSAAP